MKLVIFPALDAARLQQVRAAAEGLAVVNAADPETAAREIVDAEGFFGKITPELLSQAQRLRWVQAPTASLEHYVFPALVDHPCQLSNMRGLFSDVIADHVFGFILCFARNLHRYIRQQTTHTWLCAGGEAARSDFITGPGLANAVDMQHQHLADCTLGVVGVGEIGAEVLRRGQAFGMRLLGVDPQRTTLAGVLPEVWKPERLDELLAESDYVVIAAPHTPETYKLFHYERLRQMRRSARLINIGRGVIVDLTDLTRALNEKLIAGAALDVFEQEPLPADHPLWSMENVIITPHVAGASPRIAERHTATLVENVRRFARGEAPLTLVDKRKWY